MDLHLRKKRPEETDPGVPVVEREKTGRGRYARIRCPRCSYRPKKSDRWYCSCGHSWNTFDTRGRCPACGFQWTRTACLACHQWSAHEAWYEGGKPEA